MLPDNTEATVTTVSVTQTQALGERLGRHAPAGAIILLSGDLGAGKTALTQGIARGLGITAMVNSPTFTILKEHGGGRLPLYHFDLYRIDDAQEIWDLGFDEYFSGAGICVVEWAERVPALWDDLSGWLWLRLTAQGAKRRQFAPIVRGMWARDLWRITQAA